MRVEYWVFRIVAEGGADLERIAMVDRIDRLAALWGVARGRYHVIGGDICEAIEVYDSGDAQRDQHAALARAKREHEKTGHRHKVTMNADVE